MAFRFGFRSYLVRDIRMTVSELQACLSRACACNTLLLSSRACRAEIVLQGAGSTSGQTAQSSKSAWRRHAGNVASQTTTDKCLQPSQSRA